MACEVGLYYVLHVAKQRNKNALLRLLPGLGESGRQRRRSASSRSRSVHRREARCSVTSGWSPCATGGGASLV